jgi:hypothetical protein
MAPSHVSVPAFYRCYKKGFSASPSSLQWCPLPPRARPVAATARRSFRFITFLEREDATAVVDNMDGAKLFERVLTVNYAFPKHIKGGEQGLAAQPSKSYATCFSASLLDLFVSLTD